MSAVAVRHRNSIPARIWLVLVILAVALGALIAGIVHTLRHVKPVRPSRPPVSAVVWGDRVFFGPGTLSHWLKVHGIGYSVWAGRHPPANHLLQRQKALRARHTKQH
jgi:hypothetical protein